MKLKVYNIAAMALALIALGTNSFAQTVTGTTSSSKTDTTPRAATTSINGIQILPGSTGKTIVLNGGQLAAISPGTSLYTTGSNAYTLASVNGLYMDAFGAASQDTAYLKKMKKLQEQVSAIQKEMSALRTEEYKKVNAERQRQIADRAKDSERKFADRFTLTGLTSRYNYDRNDTELEKKIASGDVKMKTKNISKSFSVDANDVVKIDNKFGKVTINAWNKNEVKVDVDIKTYANDDDKADKLLDAVNIDSDKSSDGVSFITKISRHDGNNVSIGNGKYVINKTVINYTVYMPAKNPLNITNSYGAVILPDMNGKLTIKNQFGNFTAKALTNPDNSIEVRYGNANIESLYGSNLAVSFGALDLQLADKLNAKLEYTPAKIGRLTNSADIKVHFGEGIQIATLDKNLKTLSINSSYAPVKLASLNDANFNVTTSYGGFTYNDDKVNVTSKSPESDRSINTTKVYKGTIGKGDSDKLITIKSNFSSVKFDQ
ncbi:prefoldin domain-containing protein [Mucilaginibacter myungsuensis]|uniref:Adhesin domain-containing protein n=1 Tax=Mucilaginibacter myungsuensis TaxID=649104 RepID=A0A929KY69_9SPHI|nr:hypothetical protein [Mucilaginibacter myungsuensis]MBE9661064.1 hypothetical protein [Mucilaginibacter myungsuensis]MDN3597208.1 hypothetical protein [Mucilaginibacter myungsuensis]